MEFVQFLLIAWLATSSLYSIIKKNRLINTGIGLAGNSLAQSNLAGIVVSK